MSLKAKIEAVIYASEEPVTLAQLVGLLGHEAQAELDQLAATQHTLSLNESEVDLEEAAEADPTLNPDPDREATAEASEVAVSKRRRLQAGEGPSLPPNSEPAEPSAYETAARAAKAEKDKARQLRDYFRSLLDRSSPTTPPPTTAASRSAKSPAATASPPSPSTTTPSAASSNPSSHP